VIAAIGVLVLILLGVGFSIWRAPSVITKPVSRAEVTRAMRESREKPMTPAEKQEIEAWKQAHPGATTRY